MNDMLYMLAVCVALALAGGQALWRVVAQREGVTLHSLPGLIFSPHFIAGAFLYMAATLVYLYMQSKYEFTHIQTVVLAGSLIGSFIIAALFFSERIEIINLIGLGLLLVGIVLVVYK